MKITVYKKTGCPWAASVMAFLDQAGLPYTIKDITANPHFLREVEEISGQSKSPTLLIDDQILPDAGVEEIAEFLEARHVRV